MKKPFQVGERVSCAWYDGVFRGEILRIDNTECIQIIFDDGRVRRSHVRQCRRLIKKPRRRVWVSNGMVCKLQESDDGFSGLGWSAYRQNPGHDWVEFIEVRKPK